MKITSLSLKNFRNHTQIEVIPKKGINVFVGGNGQGKTALIEAVSLALEGKSFRQGKSWLQEGKTQGSVCLDFERNGVFEQVTVQFFNEQTIQFCLNKKKVRKPSLEKHTVFFIPEHLSAIRGDASQRRKLVDELVRDLPGGNKALLSFQNILIQKNRFLKMCKKGLYNFTDQQDYQGAINQKFIQCALVLIKYRLKSLKQLEPFWKVRGENFLQTSCFCVQYWGAEKKEIKDLAQARFLMEKELKEKQALEKLQGVSLVGPHRHDLCFLFQGHEARQRLSQGQQRALLLSWKMAQWDQKHDKNKEAPILFLDDVFSEIDQHFRKNLLEFLLNNQAQSFVTTTELKEALNPQNVAIFHLGDRFERDHDETIFT